MPPKAITRHQKKDAGIELSWSQAFRGEEAQREQPAPLDGAETGPF